MGGGGRGTIKAGYIAPSSFPFRCGFFQISAAEGRGGGGESNEKRDFNSSFSPGGIKRREENVSHSHLQVKSHWIEEERKKERTLLSLAQFKKNGVSMD